MKESNQLGCPLIAKCHEKHLVWGRKGTERKKKSPVLLCRRKELPGEGSACCEMPVQSRGWLHLPGPLTRALVVVSCLAVWDLLYLQARVRGRQDGDSDMVTLRDPPRKDHGGQFCFTFPASLDFISFFQKLWCCLGAFLFYLEREISFPPFLGRQYSRGHLQNGHSDTRLLAQRLQTSPK